MGAFTPIITGLSALSTAVSAVSRAVDTFEGFSGRVSDPQEDQRALLRAQQKQALDQLSAQQREAERQAANEAALERQNIAAQAQDAETRRRAALRRAVARQRAAYGASGLSGGDGSAEAVLLGMFQETEEDRAGQERLDSLRLNALDQELDDRRRLNVLQRAQLKQRQELERMAEGF